LHAVAVAVATASVKGDEHPKTIDHPTTGALGCGLDNGGRTAWSSELAMYGNDSLR
jgi:hypothetical protein